MPVSYAPVEGWRPYRGEKYGTVDPDVFDVLDRRFEDAQARLIAAMERQFELARASIAKDSGVPETELQQKEGERSALPGVSRTEEALERSTPSQETRHAWTTYLHLRSQLMDSVRSMVDWCLFDLRHIGTLEKRGQLARDGLMKATKSYSSKDNSVRFENYVSWWVRARISTLQAERLPEGVRQRVKNLLRSKERFKAAGVPNPTAIQLAEDMGLSDVMVERLLPQVPRFLAEGEHPFDRDAYATRVRAAEQRSMEMLRSLP